MLMSMVNRKLGQAEMGTSKGVGGYRPQVDLRQMSINKKKAAGKQIIRCILGSGFLIIIFGIIITIIGFLVIGSLCPFEWGEGAAGCIYNPLFNHTFHYAVEFCELQGATLPIINSEEKNNHIKGTIKDVTWIGLSSKNGGPFKWLSGDKVLYQNLSGVLEGVNRSNITICAVINTDGSWSEELCDESGFILCTGERSYNPFVLVGPVFILSGLFVLILSIEVCDRRRQFLLKNPDSNSDEEQLTSNTGTPIKGTNKELKHKYSTSLEATRLSASLPNQVMPE